jgi:hypothetical protein
VNLKCRIFTDREIKSLEQTAFIVAYAQLRLDESGFCVVMCCKSTLYMGVYVMLARYPCDVFVMPARFEPDGLTFFRKLYHTEFYGNVSSFVELLRGY